MANERQPNCWIRGYMSPDDYRDDPVRLATIQCPYRNDTEERFVCSHPDAQKDRPDKITETKISGGTVYSVGGIDSFATFCKPVDMHLTSLGEPSRLTDHGGQIIETTYRVLNENTNPPLLPPLTE